MPAVAEDPAGADRALGVTLGPGLLVGLERGVDIAQVFEGTAQAVGRTPLTRGQRRAERLDRVGAPAELHVGVAEVQLGGAVAVQGGGTEEAQGLTDVTTIGRGAPRSDEGVGFDGITAFTGTRGLRHRGLLLYLRYRVRPGVPRRQT